MNDAARLLDSHGNSAQPEVRIKHKNVIKIIESERFKDNQEFQKPHLEPTYGQEVYSF